MVLGLGEGIDRALVVWYGRTSLHMAALVLIIRAVGLANMSRSVRETVKMVAMV
jgi:hypothetical protein